LLAQAATNANAIPTIVVIPDRIRSRFRRALPQNAHPRRELDPTVEYATLATLATAIVIVACACSSVERPPTTPCDDSPLPAGGSDCTVSAIFGLYAVTETPRCEDSCTSAQRLLSPVAVDTFQNTVSIRFSSRDAGTEMVSVSGTCVLSGCDCVGANGLHVVFAGSDWSAEGLSVTQSPPRCGPVRAIYRATRNP
jgi:hypothetical protein